MFDKLQDKMKQAQFMMRLMNDDHFKALISHPRTGFINPREPRCAHPAFAAEARRRPRTPCGTPRRSNDGREAGCRNLWSEHRLGRSASPRGVARRSRTPGSTPRSSRLARLAAWPSAAAGIYEAGSKVQTLLKDPEFQQVIQSQDLAKITAHPHLASLFQDPEFVALFSKIDSQQFLRDAA